MSDFKKKTTVVIGLSEPGDEDGRLDRASHVRAIMRRKWFDLDLRVPPIGRAIYDDHLSSHHTITTMFGGAIEIVSCHIVLCNERVRFDDPSDGVAMQALVENVQLVEGGKAVLVIVEKLSTLKRLYELLGGSQLGVLDSSVRHIIAQFCGDEVSSVELHSYP